MDFGCFFDGFRRAGKLPVPLDIVFEILVQLVLVPLVRRMYTFCIFSLALQYAASAFDFSSWLPFILLAILLSSKCLVIISFLFDIRILL